MKEADQGGGQDRGGTRRDFLGGLLAGAGLGALRPPPLLAQGNPPGFGAQPPDQSTGSDIGSLWPVARQLATRSFFAYSFLRPQFRTLDFWHRTARGKILELLHYSPPQWPAGEKVLSREEREGYTVEQVEFSTTPYFRVPATLLVPRDAQPRQTPAVILMHDHGGFYLWGRERIYAPGRQNLLLREFRERFYSGQSPAEELAGRGILVAIIDMIYHGERRLLLDDDPPGWRDRPVDLPSDEAGAFNARSHQLESLFARTVALAGATWPGLVIWDDLRTVDYLIGREEVDRNRIGALGFSLGGLRACFAGALDPRIRAVAVASWMTSIPYQLQSKVRHDFGWPLIVPGLHRYMDLPDIAALCAPRPLLVISGSDDEALDKNGAAQARTKLEESYRKAGAEGQLHFRGFPGGHHFGPEMQKTAGEFFGELL